MNAVQEQVKGCKTACQKAAPPPVVVLYEPFKTINKWKSSSSHLLTYLGTQMKVAEQDSCFRTSDDQNDEDQKEESKHVIHLIGP